MQRESRPQNQKFTDLEQLTAIFLLFFLLFEILLVSITLIRCVEPKEADGTEQGTLVPNPSNPLGGEGDKQFIPVFSGGTIPQRPYSGSSTAALGEEILSEYAILVDAESGEILASKNADVQFSPASMTKVMTLIVACENLSAEDLNRTLPISEDMHNYVLNGAYKGSSTVFIKENLYLNDRATILDLLYGIGVASAADCTYMIAKEIAGSEEAFVALMNQKASEMGLTDTHFDNVIGHESDQNYTTAEDMAAIMMYAIQSELIVDILSYKSTYVCDAFYLDESGTQIEYSWHWYFNSSLFNTNQDSPSRIKAYETHYAKTFSLEKGRLIGGKTGTLGDGSKNTPFVYSLVSFAEANGKRYIVVTGETLQAYAVMKDAKLLYDQYIP